MLLNRELQAGLNDENGSFPTPPHVVKLAFKIWVVAKR